MNISACDTGRRGRAGQDYPASFGGAPVDEAMQDGGSMNISPAGRDFDFEKDSLHILPLHIIPIETVGLRDSRMLKNVQFDSMIEVFFDNETGSSGHVDPSKLGTMFDWPKGEKHPDGILIAKLSLLQSFDVYTLRMNLRGMGITVEDIADLRLSDTKRRELDRYMLSFTRPLIDIINAECDGVVVDNIGNLMNLLGNQDSVIALKNLKRLSARLQIILEQLPAFLRDLGDVILSLAYFKDRFDEISLKSEFFVNKLTELKQDKGLLYDPQIASAIEFIDSTAEELDNLLSTIDERIKSFDSHTEAMWENLTPERFGKVKLLIESNHGTVGGMLCGLQIKMDGFYDEFHDRHAPNRKIAEYVVSYIKPGLDRIRNIERASQYVNAL